MQGDLDAQFPELDIQILGVNALGHDVANSQMVAGRTLPWLQDVDSDSDGLSDVWDNKWLVEWRDVVVVDQQNEGVGVANLTEYNLAVPENYAALSEILVATAQGHALWQNQSNPLDVNGDGQVSAVGDVLIGINELNDPQISAFGQLPLPMPPYHQERPYLDINGDYLISPVRDLLPIINHLNEPPAAGEGEGSTESGSVVWSSSAVAAAFSPLPIMASQPGPDTLPSGTDPPTPNASAGPELPAANPDSPRVRSTFSSPHDNDDQRTHRRDDGSESLWTNALLESAVANLLDARFGQWL